MQKCAPKYINDGLYQVNFWQNLVLVVIGILIGSGAYLLKSFVFGALLRYRKCEGKVRNRLKYYANVLTSPGLVPELTKESSQVCRELSCELEEMYYGIAYRNLLVRIKALPEENNINEAAKKLIYLSNATYGGEPLRNDDAIQSISKNLYFGKRI